MHACANASERSVSHACSCPEPDNQPRAARTIAPLELRKIDHLLSIADADSNVRWAQRVEPPHERITCTTIPSSKSPARMHVGGLYRSRMSTPYIRRAKPFLSSNIKTQGPYFPGVKPNPFYLDVRVSPLAWKKDARKTRPMASPAQATSRLRSPLRLPARSQPPTHI